MAALVYGGHWLAQSDVSADRHVRVIGWTVAGITVSSAMNLLIMSSAPPPDAWYLVGWLRWAVSIGGGVGLLVGVIEARAIERERTTERAIARADFAESQQEWLDYLNSLLRHEVLNTSNVIGGRSTLLLEEYDPDDEARSHLETITRQSEDLTRVIRDVRVLLEATDRHPQYEAADLASTLETEVASLHDRYEGVRTDLSVADDLTVMADDLLPRLFSNLLSNAVEHNDGDSTTVRVTGERRGERAVVRIADDGPGIPAKRLDTLFERDTTRSDTHGLGLFIVRTLAERYGGTVALTETGPDGTTITVELPLAGFGPDTASRDPAWVPTDSE
ncbi:sensor histidine kinase [Halomicrobium zhouii]|nr:HAMP domain-containing sensor histidine kinase [Halomicrobium zhouii]